MSDVASDHESDTPCPVIAPHADRERVGDDAATNHGHATLQDAAMPGPTARTPSDREDVLAGEKRAPHDPPQTAKTRLSALTDMADGDVVIFDVVRWSKRFPDLAIFTSEEMAAMYFDMAQNLYLNNSAASIVRDLGSRAWLFDLLVAHLTWLNRPMDQDGAGPGSVGPVTEARQGSISVKYDLHNQPASASWFMQSQYGAMYWQAISAWRGMRFIPARASRARIWP